MRKLLAVILALTTFTTAFAQEDPTQATPKKTYKITNRAGDHFMLQLATNAWDGTADSVKDYLKGFNRSANVYMMFNKPFKGNPKLSLGLGIGIGTSNIYFDKMNVQISSTKSNLPFIRTDTGSYYKKYKLSTTYAEIPLELRYTANPANPNKSLKAAVGVKIGTLLGAHTKAKDLKNSAGTTLNSATVKESSKSYFNTTRFAATARVGYGLFSLFGSYNITNIFKDGVAPETKLIQVGITISGL